MTKPFDLPIPVSGVNTNFIEFWGWLSEDQLTIYFARNSGMLPDLFSATRAQRDESFTDVHLLEGVNTPNREERPTLTADGLTMFIEADFDIHLTTRISTAGSFSAHAPVANINTTSDDANPWISDDGLVLHFTSDRAGTRDIFRSTRGSLSSPFGTPVAVGELNTMARDDAPVLSRDGLEIFFGSTRLQSGPSSPGDIFHATRSTTAEGFGPPTLVAELSDPMSEDYPNWLSPDRCQLIFTSGRDGGSGAFDIWIATRPQ